MNDFVSYPMKNLILLTTCMLFCLISCKQVIVENHNILTATLRGPSAMAMIRMIDDMPMFEDTDSFSFVIRNEPAQVRAMVIDGTVDFAVLPSTMAALLYNKTHEYYLAAVPVWGTLYLFGSDPEIHTWEDLKGKKVSMMARGMTPDIMFRYLARQHGLDPDKDILLDYSFPTHIELANAIAAGITSMGVISEPLVSMVMKKNHAVRPILNFNSEWSSLFGNEVPFAQTALLVKREFATQHPEVISYYLEKLRESIDWVNDHPDSAGQLIVKYGILPDSVVAAQAIPRCNLHYIGAWADRKGIEQYFNVFYNFNPLILGGSLPDETFYYKEQGH